MRIISFNVNGIRAIAGKGFAETIKELNCDILCLQETKAQDDQVREALAHIPGFHIYTNSAEKKGYAGTAILTKEKPLAVTNDMGIPEHDKEGRVIAAEYKDFYVVTVYVPNSKSELERLPYRQQWDKDFLAYLKKLESKKPVIVCGDLNVAHKPIDLTHPKPNYNKSAGYTQIEIDGMDNFHASGLIDSYRHFYPEKIEYSWWSYRAGARAKNVGWRIDYFLVSEDFLPKIKDSFICGHIMGSDHCPVGIDL
ncbi:MAG: exodeoxyribonuclease III [Bacteroidetes bacterium]|nr:exodeoxyribonuclease III [Bacteroidota bacterium]